MFYILTACFQVAKQLVASCDFLVTADIKREQSDAFLPPNGMIILADLESFFVKNYLKKEDYNDKFIITKYHVVKGFGQAVCSDFQTPLTNSFLNRLMEDKNANISAKSSMQHNDSVHNIRLHNCFRKAIKRDFFRSNLFFSHHIAIICSSV